MACPVQYPSGCIKVLDVYINLDFPGGASGKEPANAGDVEVWVQSLGGEDPLEEGMAPHSSILAWRIPWTEEPGGLQFIRLKRVRQG